MDIFRYKEFFESLVKSIGLDLELKEEDGAESSEETEDWGVMISRFLKNYPSMNLNDTLELSYPQFKALYINMYNDKTFNVVIPFLGSSEEGDKESEVKKIQREVEKDGEELNVLELNSILAQMNRDASVMR